MTDAERTDLDALRSAWDKARQAVLPLTQPGVATMHHAANDYIAALCAEVERLREDVATLTQGYNPLLDALLEDAE